GALNVACQGVGGGYRAELASNTLPAGTDADAIQEGIDMFKLAAKNCPDSKIVFGGYSQGSAVMLNAVPKLDAAILKLVVGGVFYGYTKNEQKDGQLPGFPSENLEVFCREDDGICDGNLVVTAGHFAYTSDGSIQEGAQFLVNRFAAAGSATN
ncbi:cutinase, partial [Eremomyces bilateralis CBS 781.70]